ncbi:ATP-binding protein [Pontibacter qinzhouensis]|uniref:histidine kinase n=1 Tax=Pontibacter qinzhouensis TaxID=2603253 RepID=A0A5C8JFU5_9BACT|nr:ATP-binding protein [Pontibacter qinzhouensis]TXK36458.1 ATP-binding protein [Pontibacter qinzhouensis]
MAKFKTRARAVDMLGRQQIAGIPTAISELFKNAHDAYADRVEVDYYRSDRLFVLRDDGIGMTKEDFEKRWLTLGTESKLGGNAGLKPPYVPPGKKLRPSLGEKGIGRLAIAAIGPQLFVLTRAKRDDGLHDLVAAYIHWGIFEQPGIDLDDIEIPIKTFSNGKVPNAADVEEMLNTFRGNINRFKDEISDREKERFENDFQSIAIDPSEIDQYEPTLSLSENGFGTHFIIIPANEILEADISNDDSDKASPLLKSLLGFTNTMTPDHEPPAIRTAFRDHKSEEIFEDLIEAGEFFTPKEFQIADHHIFGEFDEFGQFRGTISIYGKQYQNHTIHWTGARGSKTECGPFKINFAEVQASQKESKVSSDEYGRLIGKTRKIGGLYIYKNGIRILPYGDTDVDWLDIEKRRTKSAGYYHFSHRNIFGIVEIDQARNKELSEKAGREGFRENKAYRQFQDILSRFFVQIAADFFREEGLYGEEYDRVKKELTRLELARRDREKQVSVKKKKLSNDLEKFFSDLDSNKPQDEALLLAESMQKDLVRASNLSDSKLAAYQILTIESKARQKLRELEDKYKVAKPKGVGLPNKLLRDYQSYEASYQKLQKNTFNIVRELIEGEVSEMANRAKLELDRRVRVELALRDLSDQALKSGKEERSETYLIIEKVHKEVKEVAKASVEEIENTLREVLSDFERIDFVTLEDNVLIDTREKLETRILEVKEQKQDYLRYIRAQLEAIKLEDGAASQMDQMEALEQRNSTLEERADMDLQLSQLGMAIEVINHEFDSSIRGIRHDLRRLKAWADVNQSLSSVYNNLRTSFDHLDGYLTLFTPLHRRLYRNEVEIKGAEIRTYIDDLFKKRLERHEIELKATQNFIKKTIIGYPSSFYPVFVNIVDNAIFWLKDQPVPRIIELDAKGKDFYISNNGPIIPERNFDVIFEQGVSYKPGGRGLGLFISKEVLNKIGYDLSLIEPRPNMNVTFCINPKSDSDN